VHGLILAARPLFLPGGVALYLLGAALGGRGGSAWAIAIGALVVVLAHLVTHFVNDAEDVETDERTTAPTALTGGSRAIQRGLVTPARLMRVSAGLAVAVVALVVLEAGLGDPRAAAIHLAILVLGYGYSGRPFTLGRRGLGEVATATVMGVLVPLSGAHAAGGVTRAAGAAAALLFAVTFFARCGTAYPDLDPDRETGKLTIPVLLGRRGSALLFVAIAVAVAAIGLAVAPLLPAPGWQRINALLVAAAAAGAAWLIRTGRADRAPTVVPALGIGANAVTLAGFFAAWVLS
jgi:1,4-dihydroxy-2-naphthoate octaprenyltransferase